MLGGVPPIGGPLHRLLFGATLLEYNVHHLVNRRHDGPDWASNAQQVHWALSALGMLLCLSALPRLSAATLVACVLLGLLSFAYSTPLLPHRFKTRLKDYGLIKIVVLTGVWVLATTVLPALHWNVPIERYWMEIIIRVLLIFPLCIAFDIRDAKPDLNRGIHTLPNTLGIPAAYRATQLMLLLYAAWGLARCVYRSEFRLLIVYAICGVAAWGAISLSRRRPEPFVYLVLIDGVMLLYGLLQAFL